MVVVEHARKHIGSEISCEVTSLVQTASGRMLFARYLPPSRSQERQAVEPAAESDAEVDPSPRSPEPETVEETANAGSPE